MALAGARAAWFDLYSAHCLNNEFAGAGGDSPGFKDSIAYGIELFAPTN